MKIKFKMNNKKIFNNKNAKGISALILIMFTMLSVLIISLFFVQIQKSNEVTGMVPSPPSNPILKAGPTVAKTTVPTASGQGIVADRIGNKINDKPISNFYTEKKGDSIVFLASTNDKKVWWNYEGNHWQLTDGKEEYLVSKEGAVLQKNVAYSDSKPAATQTQPAQSSQSRTLVAPTTPSDSKPIKSGVNCGTNGCTEVEVIREGADIKVYVNSLEGKQTFTYPADMLGKRVDIIDLASFTSLSPDQPLKLTNGHSLFFNFKDGTSTGYTDLLIGKDGKTDTTERLELSPKEGVQKELTITKQSGTTITTVYTPSSFDNMQRVVQQDASGKTTSIIYTYDGGPTKGAKIEVTPDAYAANKDNFEDANLGFRIIRAASQVDMSTVGIKDGVLMQENSKVYISGMIVTAVKDDRLISKSSAKGYYSNYENAKCKNNDCSQYSCLTGCKVANFEGQTLKSVENHVTNSVTYLYEYSKSKDESYPIYSSTISINGGPPLLTITNLEPVNNPKSPVNGLFQTDKVIGGKQVYLETSRGPFGISGTNYLSEDGTKLTEAQIKELGLPDPKYAEDSINEIRKVQKKSTLAEENSARFFADAEKVLTAYQGFQYYAPLFLSDTTLLKWRDSVDKIFATAYLGTEYWSSAICGSYLDGESEGFAYAETPQGFAQLGAHIEATRSQEINTGKGRAFVYKITFNIKNGDYDKDPRAPEEMQFNVILTGEKGATIFKEKQKVKRGSSYSKTGRNAIVQESNFVYDKVCLSFDNKPLPWKISDNRLCTTIKESTGEPTSISALQSANSSAGKPSDEVNDF